MVVNQDFADEKAKLRKSDLKQPFQVTRDDDDRAKDKGRVITLRLNEKELELLQRQKDVLDTDVDGTALKFFWKAGWNVTQRAFSEKMLGWLASRDRVRSRRNPHKNIRNVIQKKDDLVTHPDNWG